MRGIVQNDLKTEEKGERGDFSDYRTERGGE